MKRISGQYFCVADLTHLQEFYRDALGMRAFEGDGKSKRFGYVDQGCFLQFDQRDVSPYEPAPNDFYWKIGITLHDLDAAIAFLKEYGVKTTDPVQFRDIGYMSKITDPCGLTIELLQQGFEGNAKPVPHGHLVGAQATLAHITLRVKDLAVAQSYFHDELGMRLMSVQPVRENGFCLYFYTWSDEDLPDPDLSSVANREWLWSRPYTLIELQHLEMPGASVQNARPDMAGFTGFSYMGVGDEKETFVSRVELEKLV